MESPTPDYDPQLVQWMQLLLTRKELMVGALALFIYDPFLTFHREYKYIWKAGWTASKVIYLTLRYGAVAFQAILYGKDIFGTNVDPSYCRLIAAFDLWPSVLTYQLIHLTMALRINAMYQNQRWPRLFLAAAFLVSLAATTFIDYSWYSNKEYAFINNDLEFGCSGLYFDCEPYIRAVWAPSVFFNTVILGMTIFKALEQRELFSTRLLTVLYRDNFSYFFILYTLELTLLFIFNFFPVDPGSIVTSIADIFLQGFFRAIVCIGCCRMILNLRGVLTKPSEFNADPNTNTVVPTTIQFAHLGGTSSSGSMTTSTTPSSTGTVSFSRPTKSVLEKVVEEDMEGHELVMLRRKELRFEGDV